MSKYSKIISEFILFTTKDRVLFKSTAFGTPKFELFGCWPVLKIFWTFSNPCLYSCRRVDNLIKKNVSSLVGWRSSLLLFQTSLWITVSLCVHYFDYPTPRSSPSYLPLFPPRTVHCCQPVLASWLQFYASTPCTAQLAPRNLTCVDALKRRNETWILTCGRKSASTSPA